MVVREAVPEDAGAIGAAHAEAWRVAYADLFTPEALAEAVKVREEMWPFIFNDPDFARSTLLVAVDAADAVEGFIHFGPAHADARIGEVYGFYVHPRAWGAGAAGALMQAAIFGLREQRYERALLWTHVGAGQARAFYEHSGWRLSGRTDVQAIASPDEPSTVVEYVRTL